MADVNRVGHLKQLLLLVVAVLPVLLYSV